jgi:hypothetical protein
MRVLRWVCALPEHGRNGFAVGLREPGPCGKVEILLYAALLRIDGSEDLAPLITDVVAGILFLLAT